MADQNKVDGDTVEENILYDLTIHEEWQQEPEITNRIVKEKPHISLTAKLTSAAYRSTWTFLRTVGVPSSTSPCSLPVGLIKLVSSHMNWHIAVSLDGKNVAVLQDQVLEIRSSRDEYASVVGRSIVSRDAYPQWRTLAWSPEADMLACSDSTGKVEVFDLFGSPVCTIHCVKESLEHKGSPAKPNTPSDLSSAVVGLIFTQHAGPDKWSLELMVINFQGVLRKYLLSRDGDTQELHMFSFVNEFPRGVSAVAYLPGHRLLYVGGQCEPDALSASTHPTARQYGITAWRMLSDFPHYKLVTDYEDDLQKAKKMQLMKRLRRMRSRWSGECQDGIYRLSISPGGTTLASVHHSGRFSVWELPSLRMKRTWLQEQQPGFDEVNQEVVENPKKRKVMKEYLQAYNLVDASWWSDEAVILVRGTGALSVCSSRTLRNLLGTSPEWFYPAPHITSAFDGGFLGLECECKYNSAKRHLVEDDTTYEDTDDEEDATMLTKSTKYIKQLLYFVTDSERFQPPRKRPKLMTKTYRLVCLRSTTPEELYSRKIDNEEYGEALALAKAYSLDCDLVYQRQWRKTTVSVASIQDYLSKISKRSWVLHECLERVPENIDAMKELLQFGLRGTDLEALIAIGNGTDEGRFILCDRHDVYEDSLEGFSYEEEGAEEAREKERIQKLLDQVNFSRLTLEQKELCRARMKLLQYLDRLATYEEILGGIHAAEERFDPLFFEHFRAQNIVEVAAEYARACDWQALELVFLYHGEGTLPHRLAIISNFPETFSPLEYQALLPEAGSHPEDPEVLPWEQLSWREEDWCETAECQDHIHTTSDNPGTFLYEENIDLEPFRGKELSREQLREWYSYRAMEIEALSSQVDHALQLINLAIERNVQGLESLLDDLVTMEVLVYECFVDDSLTFSKFQQMSDIEKLKLMMSQSSDEMYVKNVRRWLVPFLQRCDKKSPGSFSTLMHDYLISMAVEDLNRCLMVFESSKADVPNPVISDVCELLKLAMECIYTCQNHQLSQAFSILECLPQRGFGVVSEKSARLHNSVDELEGHLVAAEILENNGIPQIIACIRDTQNNREETMKLFTKLTRMAGRKSPPLTKDQWRKVLQDLLTLRDKAFQCLDQRTCYQIFVESLLCSGCLQTIQLAGEMVECSAQDANQYPTRDSDDVPLVDKVTYDKAVQLVLAASQEYFNSSASLTDPCMELARACLCLIKDQPTILLEELDLIESLAILEGFGVTMLPVQVRMCEDHLELIQKCLDSKPFTYKNSQRLLKLGRLLRVKADSDKERDGHVLKKVAQTAIKCADFHVAYETCRRLMDEGYAAIWTECKALAETENFNDIQAKTELLSFAVTHCSAEMIEPILHAKCLLETQILYECVHCHVQDRESSSPGENPFSPRGAILQTKEILSSTSHTTKAVLSSVSDKKWWKKTLRSLQNRGRPMGFPDEDDDGNQDFQKQGCHPFYADVMPGSYLNKSEADYSNLHLPKMKAGNMEFSEAVLRTGKLEETLTEGVTRHSSTEVLLRLAEDALTRDTALGLAYLLALPESLDASVCFNKMPNTAISLQLAAYYYALQIFGHIQPGIQPFQAAMYTYSPSDLIQTVMEHVDQLPEQDWPVKIVELVPQLRRYQELLLDYNQAQMLKGLGRGVDVGRFTHDAEYKQETILGLAMTSEQSVYEIALSLANRYQLPLWEVYMTHLEYLFDAGMKTAKIEERIKKLGFMSALKEQPEDFSQRMKKYVYPTINGTDHSRLIYYYTLLAELGQPEEGTPHSQHLKLLKKIRSAVPGLDYKKLTSGVHKPLDILRPALNSGNVHVMAKLAPKIPDSQGGFLASSVVFCAWATKLFFQGESAHKVEPQSMKDWIVRYEMCREYEAKMAPADFIHFIESIIFVSKAVEQLTVDCRSEIVRRALKYSRQQQNGKQKAKQAVPGGGSWEEAVSYLQQAMAHLKLLNADIIVALQEAEDVQLNRYAVMFDLSRSEPDKLEELLVQVILDGQDPSVVEDLLQVATRLSWTPKTAVQEAIKIVISAIKNPEDINPQLGDSTPAEVLRNIVQVISEHQREGGDLVNREDVMSLLRPFCSDSSVAVEPRLDVLQTLEQSFDLGEDDLSLLILYRTQALVLSSWDQVVVNRDDVSSDAARYALFKQLLSNSSSLEHFNRLTQLLLTWPELSAVKQSESPPDNPWFELLSEEIALCGKDSSSHVINLIRTLQDESPLSEQCLEGLFLLLKEKDMVTVGVKCILLSEHVHLYDQVTTELSGHVNENQSLQDEELLLLLLKCHLTARLVNTHYYPQLVTYVLSHQTTGEEPPYYLSVNEIANQLQEQGHDVEAGTLMLQHRGMHESLRTFDTALNVLSHWLSR